MKESQEGGFSLPNPIAAAKAAAEAAKAKAAAVADAAKAKAAAATQAAKDKAQSLKDKTKQATEGIAQKAAQAAFAARVASFTSTIPEKLATIWSYLKIPVLVLIVLGILGGLGYAGWKYTTDMRKVQSAKTDKQPAIAKEGFQVIQETEDATPEDTTLLNTQQLAIKQAGFLGPLAGGSFATEEATTKALKAGFRCLVLQIDFLESKKGAAWAEPGVPTLLWKDSTGAVTSTNSGTIQGVAETIAAIGFNGSTPNSTQPIVLYLHVNRAPSPIQSPKEYIRFLSQIAKSLAPLAPFHLGLTPAGSFHRQAQEKELLMMPLSAMENKVIILSNADTSLFRSVGKLNLADKYNPADDLDFWVNLRVYLDKEKPAIGITQVATEEANAVITTLGAVTEATDAEATAMATKGKRRFTIAMPPWDTNPTLKELDWALNRAGINMVPLEIFATGEYTEIERLGKLYGNRSYRPKPIGMRNMAV